MVEAVGSMEANGRRGERPAALELRGVVRRYHQATEDLEILRGVDLRIERGEMVALVGPSGSGKSTLLHVAGLLEPPTEGQVLFDGRDCGPLTDAERTRIRQVGVGFVYQFHHLLPEFTALENVMVPQMIRGLDKGEARDRARQLLELVGLSHRMEHRPARLSGGEQQRVAIVRAIANVPAVMLADEPTGNLDPETSSDVFNQLRRIVEATGIGALVATHNMALARRMNRIVTLDGGRLTEVA
ncbi:MAG: ABC transporter ATP-binding protein [Alphaproteobacteria bacterium]|nr:ABC transporter ATP-binding protein [Alphaproteobacteria bacterium]